LADRLHLMDRDGYARRLLGRLLGLRNDLGLLAEEYDSAGWSEASPQAFSAVALVNPALNVSMHPQTTTRNGGPTT
jgi:GH15 family glucan-1,4-alpha-glucosidase